MIPGAARTARLTRCRDGTRDASKEVVTGDGRVTAPADCQVPVANPWMIRDYLHHVVYGGEQDVERRLHPAISDFRPNDE